MPSDTPRELARWMKAAAEAALVGNTPGPLRQYSFAFDERTKQITLKAEVDRPLDEEEREDLRVAETEMYSERFFDDEEVVETVIVVVPLPHPLSPLQGGVAYTRDDARAVPS